MIKNYVISYDLTSPTGPIRHKKDPCKLRVAIVEASFRNDSWFLMKILYVSRSTNDTTTAILGFSAEVFGETF